MTRSTWSLALLALGSLITSLDFTVVYVALPDIARDVGFAPRDLQWVVSAYAITYGGFLLLGGRLCDLAGRRRMFVLGMALFGGASLLGGLARDPAALIAARALQGIGAAVLFPATLSLVSSAFREGRERNRAMTVWAIAGAAGLSLGALLGGVLTQLVGWQGVFFVNIPLVAIAAPAAFVLLAADGDAERGRLDLPGAVTGTAGATLLVLAIAQESVSALAAAAVLLAAFVVIERRSASPLVPLRLLGNRSLRAALLVIFAFGMSLQAAPYFLTLYLQDVLGYGALAGGVAFLAPTFAITGGNLIADRLVDRYGTRTTLIAGMAVGAIGGVLLAAGMAVESSYWALLGGIAITGLGMGLVYPAMFIAAAAGVPEREHGIASGMASTALQVGAGTGLAVLVGFATADLGGRTGDALRSATADGLAAANYALAAIALLGVAAALVVPRRRASPALQSA